MKNRFILFFLLSFIIVNFCFASDNIDEEFEILNLSKKFIAFSDSSLNYVSLILNYLKTSENNLENFSQIVENLIKKDTLLSSSLFIINYLKNLEPDSLKKSIFDEKFQIQTLDYLFKIKKEKE